MTTFVELLKTIAWPATTLIVVFVFRGDIRALLSRISHIKHDETEVSFQSRVADLQTLVTESRPAIAAEKSASDATAVAKSQYHRIAEISPRDAILSAWRDLEFAGVAALVTRGVSVTDRALPPRKLGEILRGQGLLSPSDHQIFEELRQLRNQAMHASNFQIDAESAGFFSEIAVSLREDIERSPVKNG